MALILTEGEYLTIAFFKGVVVTEATSSSIVHEEVVDEGFNQHFKSLTDILASSTLSKQCPDGNNVYQTAKTMRENGPKSPSFEWLNSEVLF